MIHTDTQDTDAAPTDASGAAEVPGATERTAQLTERRPQGAQLLSEVCRRIREARFAVIALIVCLFCLMFPSFFFVVLE